MPDVANNASHRLAATLDFDAPVTRVKLVSPARSRALSSLGIETVRDLLTCFPRRYVDMSQVCSAASAEIGALVTVAGQVHEIELKHSRSRTSFVTMAITDSSGVLMVTCFRQPWLMDRIHKGDQVAVSGKVEFNYGYKRMTNPLIELVDPTGEGSVGRVLAVHPATEKLSSAWMRRIVSNALELVDGLFDPLPLRLRQKYRLPSREKALRGIHEPSSMEEATAARRRLAYEEVLLLELQLMSAERQRGNGVCAVSHVVGGPRLQALAAAMPFELTQEQAQARDEILQQLAANKLASHMLLGDVGTGKTAVAAFALAAAADTGTQAAMMAPTEVLARQYAEKLGPLLNAAGIRWAVLTGSTATAERADMLSAVAEGQLDVLFGTHALLEPDVVFKHMSLAVIDEQQRFGVEQRATLLGKGNAVDALYLTATPIPRTLALTLYGSLTLSYLKSRPLNAAGNCTRVLSHAERGVAYDAALAAMREGRQVYVVCPLIGLPHPESERSRTKAHSREDEFDDEGYAYASISIEDESDIAADTAENAAAATEQAAFLQDKVFSEYKVELLHGRMNAAQKAEVMERFRSGATQVLVATTVIEVGVDVPNATVMIIEDADRFGLSQLHQLRGRVGRGSIGGEVFLVSGSKAPSALERLAAMEQTEDGFELASYDLSLRREGDILGNRQSGTSSLKLVNVVRDDALIEAAHADARAILDADPALGTDEYRALGREVRMAFKTEYDATGV